MLGTSTYLRQVGGHPPVSPNAMANAANKKGPRLAVTSALVGAIGWHAVKGVMPGVHAKGGQAGDARYVSSSSGRRGRWGD